MKEKLKILGVLSDLNLEEYPTEEIRGLLHELVYKVPLYVTDFHQGRCIERAVNNTVEEPLFISKARISYKPKHLNGNYQRASIPNETMFYGSVLFLDEDKIEYERIIGAYEACELLRDDLEGESLITFGKWEVIEDLPLVTIIDPYKDYSSKYLNGLKVAQNNFIKGLISDEDDRECVNHIYSFLSSEFSKQVKRKEEFNYLISSIFANSIVSSNFDGVYYPSVQAFGEGMCVAIIPEAVDKLCLKKVMLCNIEKHGKVVQIDNLKLCVLESADTPFVYSNI